MSKKKKKNNMAAKLAVTVLLLLCVAGYQYINGGKDKKSVETEASSPGNAIDEVIGYAGSKATTTDVAGQDKLEEPARLTDRKEVMLYKPNFIVSYNTDTYCPNYVAWHLTSERVSGNLSRSNKFRPDEDLSYENRVTTSDYANSGYDRGHMCPAADNKDSEENMRNSFLMTNMCPQNHSLNAGDWQELENQCRDWTLSYGDLYIVSGPVFASSNYKTIGKPDRMKIAVPDSFFKVVLMMGKNPKAIGFVYPNSPTNKDIRDYTHSVDEIEQMTGIDFYPSLPDELEDRIEAECRPDSWGI